MHPKPAVVATASLLLLALTGCVGLADDAATTPTPTVAPETSAPAPTLLTCDDLASADLVATTLEGADGVAAQPVPAVNDYDAFDGVLLEGAGGLPCSWRVGSGMPEYNTPSDWAYLRIDVLPGAAGQWVPLSAGDAPSTDTRTIEGIEASVSGGDRGWSVSAPVGDSWVVLSISAAGLTGAGSRFSGLGGDVMIDRLADVAGPAFTAVQQASPEQLAWPAVELRQTDAVCNGGLDEQGILAAEQVPADASVEYETLDPTTEAPAYFSDAVRAAARTFTCDLWVDALPLVTITTARGFSPLFDRLRAPDGDVGFAPFDLADAPADAAAVVAVTDDGPSSPAYLSIGGTLYEIQGDGAQAVAQAIVAQTY
ncbi:hypothetical protein [Agromyces sp. CF514]|uniref:hypothetical protein n=1 Tax=Agromyces sp. CF514 TaxID=1881031 RepID=UPI000B843758|nr:hypothetical protein [Agromyces sp. CF514]